MDVQIPETLQMTFWFMAPLRKNMANTSRAHCFVSMRKTSQLIQPSVYLVSQNGFHISALGVSPDKNRVQAIKQMQPLNSATEARSFLGLVNTVARFVPNLAAMTEPIRLLTHKNSLWSWGLEQSEAFEKLRNLISSDTVLAHFDPSLPTQVRHDACKITISLCTDSDAP